MTALSRILIERALPQDGESRATRTTARSVRRTRSVTVNLAESPLSWLHARRLISERQYAAGEQLRLDYERASLGSRVTMAWDAAPIAKTRGGASRSDPTDRQLNAKARFNAAIAEAGAGLSDILWRVVCAGETVPIAEKALSWPVRSGRLVLTIALDRVADYYRFT